MNLQSDVDKNTLSRSEMEMYPILSHLQTKRETTSKPNLPIVNLILTDIRNKTWRTNNCVKRSVNWLSRQLVFLSSKQIVVDYMIFSNITNSFIKIRIKHRLVVIVIINN